MVGAYRELFVVIATSAATLIGLLFVAVSVSKGRSQAHPPLVRGFRAAAALLAFTNPFAVSMFGLVPGTNIGYPAAIIGVIGVMFVAAGVHATISLPARLGHRRPAGNLDSGAARPVQPADFFGVDSSFAPMALERWPTSDTSSSLRSSSGSGERGSWWEPGTLGS